MHMLITGGTGLIGRALIQDWLQDGHQATVITRSPADHPSTKTQRVTYTRWTDFQQNNDLDFDVVVNLAGETINQRWTIQAKNRITASRTLSARRLAEWADRRGKPFPLLINASGISIYGSSATGIFDESSTRQGNDFLADVVRKWEESADQIPALRTVKLRIAPVLAARQGVFPQMTLPFKLGVGGPIGSGSQPFSWIHLDDMIRLIRFIIHESSIEGVVNAAAPESLSNGEFGRVLAKEYRRPYWMPVPSWILRFVFGEMSSLLLEGQHVYPAKALEHGFTFQFGTAERAIPAIRHAEAHSQAHGLNAEEP